MLSWLVRDESPGDYEVFAKCQSRAPRRYKDDDIIFCEYERFHLGHHRNRYRTWQEVNGESVEVQVPFPHVG